MLIFISIFFAALTWGAFWYVVGYIFGCVKTGRIYHDALEQVHEHIKQMIDKEEKNFD